MPMVIMAMHCVLMEMNGTGVALKKYKQIPSWSTTCAFPEEPLVFGTTWLLRYAEFVIVNSSAPGQNGGKIIDDNFQVQFCQWKFIISNIFF